VHLQVRTLVQLNTLFYSLPSFMGKLHRNPERMLYNSTSLTESYAFLISMNSSVSIGSDYGLDDLGSIPGRDKEFFPSSLCFQTDSDAYPASNPIQWVPGDLSAAVNRLYCRGQEWVGAIPPLVPSIYMTCSGAALLYYYTVIPFLTQHVTKEEYEISC
jgi:hypothetical protein